LAGAFVNFSGVSLETRIAAVSVYKAEAAVREVKNFFTRFARESIAGGNAW
jgi:hypothetical protein